MTLLIDNLLNSNVKQPDKGLHEVRRWTELRSDLSESQEVCKKEWPIHVAQVLDEKPTLLMDELLTQHDFPDRHLVKHMTQGFRLTGWVCRSGLFPFDPKPPASTLKSQLSMAKSRNTATLTKLSKQAPDEVSRRAWAETLEEVDKGWIEEDENPDLSTVLVAKRFGLLQGPKVRVIDDCRACAYNLLAGIPEKYRLQSVEYIAAFLLRAMLDPRSKGVSISGKTLDLTAAYKQYATHPFDRDLLRIGVKDTSSGHVRTFKVNSLPFGATGSVSSFLRCAAAIWFLGSHALGIPWTNYFDDFPIFSKDSDCDLVEEVATSFLDLLHVYFARAGKKATVFTKAFKALGLIIDLSHFGEGYVTIGHTQERGDELRATITRILESNRLSHAEAESLRGRLHWYTSFLFGRRSSQALNVLSDWVNRSASKGALPTELRESLTFLRDVALHSEPLKISRSLQRTFLIFTDGSLEGNFACVGGILHDSQGVPLAFFSVKLNQETKLENSDLHLNHGPNVFESAEKISVESLPEVFRSDTADFFEIASGEEHSIVQEGADFQVLAASDSSSSTITLRCEALAREKLRMKALSFADLYEIVQLVPLRKTKKHRQDENAQVLFFVCSTFAAVVFQAIASTSAGMSDTTNPEEVLETEAEMSSWSSAFDFLDEPAQTNRQNKKKKKKDGRDRRARKKPSEKAGKKLVISSDSAEIAEFNIQQQASSSNEHATNIVPMAESGMQTAPEELQTSGEFTFVAVWRPGPPPPRIGKTRAVAKMLVRAGAETVIADATGNQDRWERELLRLFPRHCLSCRQQRRDTNGGKYQWPAEAGPMEQALEPVASVQPGEATPSEVATADARRAAKEADQDEADDETSYLASLWKSAEDEARADPTRPLSARELAEQGKLQWWWKMPWKAVVEKFPDTAAYKEFLEGLEGPIPASVISRVATVLAAFRAYGRPLEGENPVAGVVGPDAHIFRVPGQRILILSCELRGPSYIRNPNSEHSAIMAHGTSFPSLVGVAEIGEIAVNDYRDQGIPCFGFSARGSLVALSRDALESAATKCASRAKALGGAIILVECELPRSTPSVEGGNEMMQICCRDAGSAYRRVLTLLHAFSSFFDLCTLMADDEEDGPDSVQAVLAGKSPNTILKHVGPVRTLCEWLLKASQTPPFAEKVLWSCVLKMPKTAATTLDSSLRAIKWSYYTLGLRVQLEVFSSPRIHGVVKKALQTKNPWCPASPLKVSEVLQLHAICCDRDISVIDRCGAAHFLAILYARARASDIRCVKSILIDVHNEDWSSGFIELGTLEHKTSRLDTQRRRILPLVIPGQGIAKTPFGQLLLDIRAEAGLPNDQADVPFLPAPLPDGSWSSDPLSSSEITRWLRYLLPRPSTEQAVSSHSLKVTSLVWCSKFGMLRETKRVLGHHADAATGSDAVYGRELQSAALREYVVVLDAVATGKFLPDQTRSGHFSSGWTRESILQAAAFPQDSEVLQAAVEDDQDEALAVVSDVSDSDEEAPEEQSFWAHPTSQVLHRTTLGYLAMTSSVDSAPFFVQRADEISLAKRVVDALKGKGVTTLAQLAFCVGQPGQVLSQTEFDTWSEAMLVGITVGEKASLRRLILEAQTMLVASLKDLAEPAEHASPKKVGVAERNARMDQLRTQLAGVSLTGQLEPSHALLDMAVQQWESRCLKYIGPEKCHSREDEVQNVKPLTTSLSLEGGKLKVTEAAGMDDRDIEGSLQVLNALRRRGVAYAFARLISWERHEAYVSSLFRYLTKPAQPGYRKVSLRQILRADKLAFSKLSEAGEDIRADASGTLPLDAAIGAILHDYDLIVALLPMGDLDGKGKNANGRGGRPGPYSDNAPWKGKNRERQKHMAGQGQVAQGQRLWSRETGMVA
ncbi:unnamed protein product [Symbiodinium sp. CCMP2592]|nr:unnamed protein product [Symbiodinium sp. CCMP2592]